MNNTKPKKKSQGDLDDTQPTATKDTGDPSTDQLLRISALLSIVLIVVVLISSFWGLQSGRQIKFIRGTLTVRLYMDQQYSRALDELEKGDSNLALERLRFIKEIDPTYPGLNEKIIMAENAVSGFGIGNEWESTPTPTKDPRPNQELYDAAWSLLIAQQWTQALDSIAALRNNDPDFRAVQVDGMIYTALRNRGVEKILNTGELEGGLYDFSLAEQFGPIDRDAEIYRGWARLYLQGNGFWMAYPEVAIGYYAQVAAAAPGLHDLSGMSAFYRYWRSLIQYADQLAAEENWCEAYEYYRQAADARADGDVEMQAIHAQKECFALTPAPTKPKPTDTPLPATDTPIPPTNTSIPSTDTEEPSPPQETLTPTMEVLPK